MTECRLPGYSLPTTAPLLGMDMPGAVPDPSALNHDRRPQPKDRRFLIPLIYLAAMSVSIRWLRTVWSVTWT